MNKDQVRTILRERGMSVRKKYGQNFLIDKNIVDKILRTSMIGSNDTVIEIGPGLGALTEGLSNRAKRVIAYEIDAGLSTYLTEHFAGVSHVAIHQQDILEVTLSVPEPIKVISNLPYYITTPILFRLLEGQQPITSITVMMQKEVAERLVATPRTKQYNALSVILQFLAEVKIEFFVPKTCFYPVPEVDSAVVSITLKRQRDRADVAPFIQFVKHAFHQRRKTMLNNLTSMYHWKKSDVETLLEQHGFSPSVRAEEVSLNEFIQLYTWLVKTEM
jgi:16S rRNA (adenine1518-N6/adenine1519-N6)-dimethyltransferase